MLKVTFKLKSVLIYNSETPSAMKVILKSSLLVIWESTHRENRQ
jgi:hypothetical protein